HPGEEIVVIAWAEEGLPAKPEGIRQVRTNLPVIIGKNSQGREIRAKIHPFVLTVLRIKADVGFGERVVEREIEEVVESELRTREDVGELLPALPCAVFRIPETELEAMTAAVVRHHVAPLKVVLNKGRVRKTSAVRRNAGDIKQWNVSV